MATQNHVTKRPITTGNAVRKAGAAQADDAAKLAKKVEEQEAQQLAQAEQAGAVQEVNAMTVAQAEAAGAVAAEGSIGAVSAEAAAGAAAEAGAAGAAGAGAAGAAAGAAAVSPAVIGAAALGVVAVAAAAGGGSSGGGSSSPSNNGLATDKPGNSNNSSNAGNNGSSNDNGNNAANNGGTTDKPTEEPKPADQPKPAEQQKPADNPSSEKDPKPEDKPSPAEDPKQEEQPKLVEQPAEAKAAENGQPLIAESGETKLGTVVAKLFENAAGEGKTVDYIRIGHIVASEGQIEADNEVGPRVVREVEVPVGKSATTVTKADTGTVVSDSDEQGEAAGAAKTTTVFTAYEVVKTKDPVTLEQAKAMAQKMGGQLAVIDDADEAKYLAENLRGTMGHQGEGTGGVPDNSEAAWIASSKVAGTGVDATKLDAMIRTGNDTPEAPVKIETIDFTGDKLSRFVVEYPDYKSPLTLDGKPVVDGQIINKDEFDKLVWDSSRSARGQITYEAVDSNDAKTAKPLEGAQKQTLTLTESSTVAHTMAPEKPVAPPAPPAPPAPAGEGGDTHKGEGTNKEEGNKGQGGETNQSVTKPVYPEGKNQAANVDHDKVDAELDKSLFIGTDPSKAPAFIKVTDMKETGDTKEDSSALYLSKVDENEHAHNTYWGDPAKGDFIVPKEDFDKLKWDSAQNTGGMFKFQALDTNKQAIGDEQTVTISEKPAEGPNKQEAPNKQQDPAQNQNQGSSGNDQKPGNTTTDDPKRQPGTSEEQNQGNSGSGSDAPGNQNQSGNASGQGGNTSGQTGGASGQSGNGQDQGGKVPGQNEQQPLEKPAASEDKAGEYPKNAEPVKVVHNAESTPFDKAVFGGAEGKEPPAVKILHVKGSGESDVQGLYKLVNGNPVAVEPNEIIKQADFDKLVWNATHGDGNHTITFVPVKADGGAITGATEHTVTVQEAAASAAQEPPTQSAAEPKVGVYGDATTINLTHDQAAKKIDASVFKGTDPSKEPAAVKIISVDQQNFGNDNAWEPVGGTKPAFGKSEQYDDNLGVNKVLLNADFDKAQWNAAFDNGSGNYRVVFKPADANGNVIEGATEQTLYIHEAADKPVYPAQLEVQNVATNNGDVHVNQALFKGDEPTKAPMYVRITSIAETDGESADHNVLFLKNGEKVTHEFKAGDATPTGTLILSVEQMGQLHWDAAHNNGGTFKFKPLGGDGKDIEGAEEQTVTVTEAPAPATSGTPSSDSTNSGVQEAGDTTGSGGSATEPPPGGTPSKPVIQNEGNPSSDDPSTTAAPGKDPAGTKQADADATTEGAKPRSISAKSLFSSPGHESAADSYDVASFESGNKLIDQLHQELTQG